MKLAHAFIQLPLHFDAEALAAEIGAFDEGLWRPHPSGFPGNSALPLAAVDGDPARGDALEGPMRPTPALLASPYLQQVLGSLDAVLGRIRLMRLSGRAEVEPHVDSDYYWHERTRVHVPILTRPGVRFACGDAAVHMAAGECWIFDTWRMHHVQNEDDRERIHLVVDTVGGAAFWQLVAAARPHQAPRDGVQPRHVAPRTAATPPSLVFETVNSESPMSYWELHPLVAFLLNEAVPHEGMPALARACGEFVRRWQTLWFRSGRDQAAVPEYRELLESFLAHIAPLASEVTLRNGADFLSAIQGLLRRAVRRPDLAVATEEGSRTGTATARATGRA